MGSMLRLSLLLVIVSLGLALPAQAQKQKAGEKTVVDYFLAVPAAQFAGEIPDDPLERMKPAKDDDKKTVVVQDIRNRYLKLSYRVVEVEVKLFTAREGVVMGVSLTGCCCEGTCDRRLTFLSIHNGQYSDITKEVWPGIDRNKLIKTLKARFSDDAETMADMATYKFSRRGNTVTFMAGSLPFRFRWNKGKFVRS